jgi:tetratricopeptide (TPR) repeat protein
LLRLVRFHETRGRARESLPCLLAQSRSQILTWQMGRPLIRDVAPELADAIERCLEIRGPDWAEAARRAAELIALGREKLAQDDPRALVYADVLTRVIDVIGKNGGAVVCEALAREVLAIRTAHDQTDLERIAAPRFWLGLSLLEQGQFAEAEAVAQEEVDRTRQGRWPARRIASPEVLRGAALLGQKRFVEAEEVLLRAQPLLKSAYREDFFTRLEGFGWVVRLYADSNRPEAAGAFAGPILRTALEARRNPALLHGLSARVVTCPGLPVELYEFADVAARVASEIGPPDASRATVRALAALRVGRHAQALELLEPAPDLAVVHAVRALALHNSGRSAEARSECALATQALHATSKYLSWTDRRLIEEAARCVR